MGVFTTKICIRDKNVIFERCITIALSKQVWEPFQELNDRVKWNVDAMKCAVDAPLMWCTNKPSHSCCEFIMLNFVVT